MAACPSLMFVELCESGIGIRNSNISKAHAYRLYSNWSSFFPWHYKKILL